MVQELLLYRYVCVCVLMALRMLITLTPDGTGRREKVALQIQEVAPWIQEVAPTTCVMWHFAPCGTLL